jgi:hypothetical protein
MPYRRPETTRATRIRDKIVRGATRSQRAIATVAETRRDSSQISWDDAG